MTPDAVLRDLEGLRALARSLLHGDADADDLLQDTAIIALEHRRALGDRPARAWLATVLRNRWRMDRRGMARRQAREQLVARASGPTDAATHAATHAAIDSIDRARTFARLATALVALDEPFRTTVIRRYLDGLSAAELARQLGVPAATVRSRLKSGLDRLRAALDETSPRWQRVLAPLPLAEVAGVTGATVKTKTSIAAVVVLILLLVAGGALWLAREAPPTARTAAPTQAPPATTAVPGPRPPAAAPAPANAPPPQPGQAHATVEPTDAEGGLISGRVIDWSRGDGVPGAELTFTSDSGATTVRTRDDGGFELAPPAPGRFVLSTVAAPGYLPYAPELLHSTVHVVVARGQAVRGITVFLFPALDYRGRVVDAGGAGAAGARVRLLGTPTGEQAIDKLETEWIADRDGQFTFHAADGAVLEAARGDTRGWAQVSETTMLTRQLTIKLSDVLPRDRTISGRAIDAGGAPVADALVRATPTRGLRTPPSITQSAAQSGLSSDIRAVAFAITGADGAFTLTGLDRDLYDLDADAEGFAPVALTDVAGGTRDVTLAFDGGLPLAGEVTAGGKPVPAYTLLVSRRAGIMRSLVIARSIVDASGRFSVRVAPGDYELVAAASGWAPSPRTPVTAGATDVRLTLSTGGTLRGTVVSAQNGTPIAYARIQREASGGGASAQPANVGTVTRPDGSFELTGIPAGAFSITVAAASYHPRIEAGMTASDGQTLGPITLALGPITGNEEPTVELVGIGVGLTVDGDAMRVTMVVPGGGGEAAGIKLDDRIIAIDGLPVAPLGMDGAIGKIRGVAGTTVSVTLRRNDQPLTLIVERRKLRV